MSMCELWLLLHSTESQNQKEIVLNLWGSPVVTSPPGLQLVCRGSAQLMCSEKEVATEILVVGIDSTHEIGLSDPTETHLLLIPTVPQ